MKAHGALITVIKKLTGLPTAEASGCCAAPATSCCTSSASPNVAPVSSCCGSTAANDDPNVAGGAQGRSDGGRT